LRHGPFVRNLLRPILTPFAQFQKADAATGRDDHRPLAAALLARADRAQRRARFEGDGGPWSVAPLAAGAALRVELAAEALLGAALARRLAAAAAAAAAAILPAGPSGAPGWLAAAAGRGAALLGGALEAEGVDADALAVAALMGALAAVLWVRRRRRQTAVAPADAPAAEAAGAAAAAAAAAALRRAVDSAAAAAPAGPVQPAAA